MRFLMKKITKAFISSVALTKKQAVDLAQLHLDQDQFIQGGYGYGKYGTSEFKGCSVGCMANGDHSAYVRLFGIVPEIANISDAIFEGLNCESAKLFTAELFNAIKIGSDTNNIFQEFAYWLLVDPNYGVIQLFKDRALIKGDQVVSDALKKIESYSKDHEMDEQLPITAMAQVGIFAAFEDEFKSILTIYEAASFYCTNKVLRFSISDKENSERYYSALRDKLIDLFKSETIEPYKIENDFSILDRLAMAKCESQAQDLINDYSLYVRFEVSNHDALAHHFINDFQWEVRANVAKRKNLAHHFINDPSSNVRCEVAVHPELADQLLNDTDSSVVEQARESLCLLNNLNQTKHLNLEGDAA